MKPIHTLTVNGESYDLQNRDFRHIATITNDTGEAVKQLELTRDAAGEPFSCSEFFVLATIPPATANQLYIGAGMWNWILFTAGGMSTSQTRTLAIELKHTGGGWWRGNKLSLDDVSYLQTVTNGNNFYANFRSYVNVGERVSTLAFYGGNSAFPDGTVIEVYGK